MSAQGRGDVKLSPLRRRGRREHGSVTFLPQGLSQGLSEHWPYDVFELPECRQVLVGKSEPAAAGFDNDMRGA